MTLVFVSMFMVIFMSLAGVVSRTYQQSVLQSQDEQAFQIAEDGLNYGRWRLAHAPDDFTAETRQVEDQFAGVLGEHDITFTQQPSSTIVVIDSVGRTANQPTREVTLSARYGIPSLSQYATLTNGDVWYGGQISGVVHSNGGIRMDGTSDSLMTSAQETYVCQTYHGCAPETKPGIWGTGVIQELWEFPTPLVDYNSLTLDLLDMQQAADATGTHYGSSGVFGYHVVFNADNTFSIYQVTAKGPNVWSWFSETGYEFTSHDIGTEVLIETKAVPTDGVIFVDDDLWVEGDIRDRVLVAAGRFPDSPATHADVIINGDISYGGVRDGTRVIGAIAQRHVLLPWSGAEDMLDLDGAYIAQQGRFGRRYYPNGYGSEAHALKTSMVRFGMIGSNLVPVTAWVNGGGTVISGYQTGSSSYDPNLTYLPPPEFPTTGQYQFISWEEVE